VVAVDEVSVGVAEGEVFGLIGPNGAGKTTLVNLVTGYLKADRGVVTFDGQSILGMRPHLLADLGIARTYQNLRLFEDASVLENILIGRHRCFAGSPWQLWSRRRREEREQLDVTRELADRLGLAAVCDFGVSELSYGLRRRVEIARALATDPTMLILDEPTAGMTRSESDNIGELVRQVSSDGTSVLLIEHNMRLVGRVCDEVGVLNWGKVIALGPPAEIWNDPEVRAAYLGAKTGGKGGASAPQH
jgi:branched-chain amino acid transport system ATP-binding protein